MKHKYYIILFVYLFISVPLKASILTFDSHIDIPFDFMQIPNHDPGKDTNMQVDLKKMVEGSLNSGFFVVYVPQGDLDKRGYADAKIKAEKKFSSIRKMTEIYSSKIKLVKNPEAVIHAKENNLLSAAIGIENGYVIGEDLKLLDYYYSLGARYMTLAHIGHNQIADSSIPSSRLNNPKELHGGLSRFGREVISRMNQLGMMVDISHISDKAALEAIKLSNSPVIASHSSVKSLADHPRNLSDEILFEIAKNNGVVQLVAFPSYLKVDKERDYAIRQLGISVARTYGDNEFIPSKHLTTQEFKEGIKNINKRFPLPSIRDFINHIDYVVKLIGVNHVGISSDFGGGGGVEGWMDARETQNLTNELRKRNYSDLQIKKIWSGNILRVWREVEKKSQKN